MLKTLAAVLLMGAACCVPADTVPAPTVEVSSQPGQWRSKFGTHGLVEVDLDGRQVQGVRMPFDLARPPNYDWLRYVVANGIDVRPYKFLCLSVKGDKSGARLQPMLIRQVARADSAVHGEAVANASQRPICLDFGGRRRLSVPLSAFANLAQVAERVHQINFSLSRTEAPGPAGEVVAAQIRLSVLPEGIVVPEEVAFPPADIAIADEEEFFAQLDLACPGLERVAAAVRGRDWDGAKAAWADHLASRSQPCWVWSRRQRGEIADVFERRFGGLGKSSGGADAVLRREFNWLGVARTLEKDIEWLQGPTEWTHVLSRHGYWQTLGHAYWATGDPKYAEDWVSMLTDWISDNPVPRLLTNSRGQRGTVWRTLEAGIRGDCWFDVMELFMDAPQFGAEAKYLITRSLVEHARHLHRYETEFRYGNWQVVECTGLAAIGIMLPEFREAAGWRERAFGMLVEHMEKDVYPDGAHNELTPGYHGWVMERFLKTSLLLKANGYEVPGLLERHERMFEFLMHLAQPDRRFPPLGDAGGGGSVVANMGLGALLYARSDMRFLGPDGIQPSWVWLFGPQVEDSYAEISAQTPAFTSHMMPHAKYCMMRTGWEASDRSLLFDCAPWGGGHSHQDRLQVVLYAGRDLLLDPGIYSYDQPLSNSYFRKTQAHNVLVIDGEEQLQADPEVLAWATTDGADLASGRIAAGGLAHQRTVLFVKPDYWVVVDHVSGVGRHELTRLFHLPRVALATHARTVHTQYGTGENVWLHTPDADLEMRSGWLPVGGAKAEDAPVAAFANHTDLPATLCTLLVPLGPDESAPSVEMLSAGSEVLARLKVAWPDGQVELIAVAPEPTEIRVGGHSGFGRSLCVRTGPRAEAVLLVDGTRVSAD